MTDNIKITEVELAKNCPAEPITCKLNDFNKLLMSLHIQFETLEHKGKKYKTADILDGLAAAAQYFSRAGTNTPITPQNDPNIPEREQMTVAQLRTLLKKGNKDAHQLVNDLISELPNQITAWVDKDSARYYVAEDLSDSQFEKFWDWMRLEWGLVESKDEIRLALEEWTTHQEDLLDE